MCLLPVPQASTSPFLMKHSIYRCCFQLKNNPEDGNLRTWDPPNRHVDMTSSVWAESVPRSICRIQSLPPESQTLIIGLSLQGKERGTPFPCGADGEANELAATGSCRFPAMCSHSSLRLQPEITLVRHFLYNFDVFNPFCVSSRFLSD